NGGWSASCGSSASRGSRVSQGIVPGSSSGSVSDAGGSSFGRSGVLHASSINRTQQTRLSRFMVMLVLHWKADSERRPLIRDGFQLDVALQAQNTFADNGQPHSAAFEVAFVCATALIKGLE